MNILGRINNALLQIGLWAAIGILAFILVLVGAGFLIASLYLWLGHFEWGRAVGALLTGAILFVLALAVFFIGKAVIGKVKKPQPTMMQEFNNTLGLAARMVSLVVRRDPRKAMIVSMVAGALAEFVTSERKQPRR